MFEPHGAGHGDQGDLRGARAPRHVLSAAVVAVFLCAPATALAQATITGVVRDTSGAVLPGVTVEASSPALIEKTRTAISDSSGQYRIVDLRPGTYDVSFALPGLQHPAPHRHRAHGHVHRDGERRVAARQPRGNGHRHRRGAGRGRAERQPPAGAHPGSDGRDSRRPQPPRCRRTRSGSSGQRLGHAWHAGRRRRDQQPAEHDADDARRPQLRYAADGRRHPHRQRRLGRRVHELRARHGRAPRNW